MKDFLRDTLWLPITRMSGLTNKHPVYGAIVVIVTYFLLDISLMEYDSPIGSPTATGGVILALVIFFIIHVYNAIQGDDSPKIKKRNTLSFISLAAFAILVVITYDTLVAKTFPTIFQGYPMVNVIMIVLIAPILEELAYRHLLYGRWAKDKYGPIKGLLIVGLLFIITHPITGLGGFVLYWLPTLLFFSVYDVGGIYPAILAHMIFNIVALM